jgi:hypothetical protein
MKRIELQTMLDGSTPERPFFLLPFYADRLVLRVADPDDWCVIAPSRRLVNLMAHPDRNPSGLPVSTNHYAVKNGLPRPNVVVLGIEGIGSFGSKAHRMIRGTQWPRNARRAIVVYDQVPPPLKLFPTASALGQARRVYGDYERFLIDHFHVLNKPGFGVIPKTPKPGKAAAAKIHFFRMCDRRFDDYQPEFARRPAGRYNMEAYPK